MVHWWGIGGLRFEPTTHSMCSKHLRMCWIMYIILYVECNILEVEVRIV